MLANARASVRVDICEFQISLALCSTQPIQILENIARMNLGYC